MTHRILIVVTHLLGAGHLTRAAALARACARAGHSVTLVSGGMPAALVALDGLDVVQLPPVRTKGTDFKTLLDEHGAAADANRLESRKALLLATLAAVRPDVVVTELFPFGRRVLAAEFLALLEAAHRMEPRPTIACSIRDILVAPAKQARITEAHERIARFYDLILVHGDPDLVPLDASWPTDERIRPLLRYTGYVDESDEPDGADADRAGIVVSGGSSAASLPLYAAAVPAARGMPEHPWRLLVGAGVPEESFLALRAAAPPHAVVERARRDFRDVLRRCAVSVSQAGYNTVVDLLRTGARSVLVPFEAGHETEQRLRAERLQAKGLAQVIPETDLSPERLTAGVRAALSLNDPSSATIRLDGARQSVDLLCTVPAPRVAQRSIVDWSPLDDALQRAQDAGTDVPFWWRDDDAVADTPALRRLLSLSGQVGAPVALAVIPQAIDPSLLSVVREEDGIFALVHGFAHTNHAPPGEKKAEFGAHRPLVARTADVEAALEKARERLGSKLLPVFVPPWNRIAPDLALALHQAGYIGLSAFNDRTRREAARGVVQINTHIDPIDWRGSRGLLEPAQVVAAVAAAIERRIGAEDGEPIGLLTHHLVHDEPIWSFCEAVLERLARNKVRFSLAAKLFSDKNRIAGER